MIAKIFLLGLLLIVLPLHTACHQHRSLQTAVLAPTLEAESSYRDLVEEQNMHYINQHNIQSSSFKLAANQFLSLTHEEFAAKMGSTINFPQHDQLPSVGATIPLTTNIVIDWWTAGKVSPVKDQGDMCGSCYAFAAAGDIESSYLIKYGKLYDLSEQQIVDCSASYGNSGCVTGFYLYSLKYVIKNGLNLEINYPYIDRASTCKAKITTSFPISSYYGYNGTSCSVLESSLKSRPVLASVDGINQYWQFYGSGILNFCGKTNMLNHAVQVIGLYSYTNGTSYYVVKNSWGTDWGEGGKIKIDRNVQNGNLCLICSYIYYSII